MADLISFSENKSTSLNATRLNPEIICKLLKHPPKIENEKLWLEKVWADKSLRISNRGCQAKQNIQGFYTSRRTSPDICLSLFKDSTPAAHKPKPMFLFERLSVQGKLN